ncbi:flagellar protein FlgJ [alpha proteobacterium U9-1i]|nr:flagellar protein FlgJ [alpha proteobacterium U9-1i]
MTDLIGFIRDAIAPRDRTTGRGVGAAVNAEERARDRNRRQSQAIENARERANQAAEEAAPTRARQMRPTEERLRDGNAGVRAQALEEQQMEAAASRYRGPIGPGGITEGAVRGLYRAEPEASDPPQAEGRVGRAPVGVDRLPVLPGAPEASQNPIGPGGVVSEDPIDAAARVTGASPTYLRRVMGHESGGVADARNPKSSATGHFQFIDQTWLSMMRQYGARYGAGDLAEQITTSRGGTLKVNDGATRDRIMALRSNPQWAALMGAHFTEANVATLRGALGRPVTDGEVYLAHFLGPADAVSLINAAQSRHNATAPAIEFVGRGAAQRERILETNREVFVDRRGRLRSARDLYVYQTRNFTDAGVSAIYRGADAPVR